jgi:3'(2'), 5'-bisphosphate nucleotidase
LTTTDDHALARDLAQDAGRLLLALRAEAFRSGFVPDELRKAGDMRSQELLAARLAASRPGDAVLSEEAVDDKARLGADRVWIIDPLDGTREFGIEGRDDWAVHVALWERTPAGGTPNGSTPNGGTTDGSASDGSTADNAGALVAGAVALPAQGRVLATPDPGVRPGSGHAPLRLVVSQSRASQLVKDVAARIGAQLVPCGSAGAKVATVVSGETDAYLHSGGFYEWDTAAPVAVAVAAGFHVSRIDGSAVAYNRDDPLLPDILVCRPAIAGLLLDAIREVTHGN